MYSTPTILPIQPVSSFVGQTAYLLETTDSTNRFASKLLLSKIKPIEGSVILTREQTAGRGQFGTSWYGGKDLNIAMTVILYPSFLHPRDSFRLNTAVSLGVYKGLRSYIQKDLHIKWPNDIWYKSKKIAGILVESSIQGSTLKDVMVGVGINVNQTTFPEALPNPGSMKEALGQQLDINVVVAKICTYIELEYLALKGGKVTEIEEEYEAALLGYGILRTYKTAKGLIKGTIKGIDEAGRLVLDTETGVHYFALKEIEWII
ncbi:MAG: BirA family biotin operon repressor/biotin-[acetyl-CoA-carboxylase] ligase [Limisphaerales bacterium]